MKKKLKTDRHYPLSFNKNKSRIFWCIHIFWENIIYEIITFKLSVVSYNVPYMKFRGKSQNSQCTQNDNASLQKIWRKQLNSYSSYWIYIYIYVTCFMQWQRRVRICSNNILVGFSVTITNMWCIEVGVSLQMIQSTPKYHWTPSFWMNQCDLMGTYGICGTFSPYKVYMHGSFSSWHDSRWIFQYHWQWPFTRTFRGKSSSLPRTISWNCCINNSIHPCQISAYQQHFSYFHLRLYIRWYHIILDIRVFLMSSVVKYLCTHTMFLMQYIPYQYSSSQWPNVVLHQIHFPLVFASINVFIYFLSCPKRFDPITFQTG